MYIEEVDICGHIMMVEVGDKCGNEKQNIVFFGEVCTDCELPLMVG
jgi:NAD-dependent SIR2 family protein deacetylase